MSDSSKARPNQDVERLTPHEADPERRPQPGDQERPMTEEENLDETLDETFPASDPITPKHIDGPNN